LRNTWYELLLERWTQWMLF